MLLLLIYNKWLFSTLILSFVVIMTVGQRQMESGALFKFSGSMWLWNVPTAEYLFSFRLALPIYNVISSLSPPPFFSLSPSVSLCGCGWPSLPFPPTLRVRIPKDLGRICSSASFFCKKVSSSLCWMKYEITKSVYVIRNTKSRMCNWNEIIYLQRVDNLTMNEWAGK